MRKKKYKQKGWKLRYFNQHKLMKNKADYFYSFTQSLLFIVKASLIYEIMIYFT